VGSHTIPAGRTIPAGVGTGVGATVGTGVGVVGVDAVLDPQRAAVTAIKEIPTTVFK
jgi:hypothetical protein